MITKIRNLKKIYLIPIIFLVLLVASQVVFDRTIAKTEAIDSGLPKRNIVQFTFEETANVLSKTFLRKPTPAAAQRAEEKEKVLASYGKTRQISP
jgi:hypothetical protein